MKVEFSSGNWVSITPIQGLKAKHRDAYEGAPKIYLKFDDDGKPDMSDMPLSMTLGKLQRNALLAVLITDWSFVLLDDEGVEVADRKLPVPHWDGTEIVDNDAFGEIGLDDMQELEDYIRPYIMKIQRKPDPKTTTTDDSTALSKAAGPFPRA